MLLNLIYNKVPLIYKLILSIPTVNVNRMYLVVEERHLQQILLIVMDLIY